MNRSTTPAGLSPRTQLIHLTTARDVLDLRGDKFDAMLLLAGAPLAFHWCDCADSICQ